MSRKSVYFVLVAVCVIGAALLLKVTLSRSQTPSAGSSSAALPDQFSTLALGMSETQVAALLGPAPSKKIYPKFEHKTPAEWAKLQQQVAATVVSTAPDSPNPSIADVKAAVKLTHRYHDVWQYQPVPNILVTLYFDEEGTLLKKTIDRIAPKH